MRANKSIAGTKAWAARVAAFCPAHDETMEFQRPIFTNHPRDNIVDLLHMMDIDLGAKHLNFSTHDPVIFGENPELKHALTAYYTFIGCPFDLLGEKSWWHGSVWCYDICMGANKESPGFDVNILVQCLICFGVAPATPAADADADADMDTPPPADLIVDDLSDDEPAPAQKKKAVKAAKPSKKQKKKDKAAANVNAAAEAPDDRLQVLLVHLFGHNSNKVRAIFEAATGYAELFKATSEKWTEASVAYKEKRALAIYRAGLTI